MQASRMAALLCAEVLIVSSLVLVFKWTQISYPLADFGLPVYHLFDLHPKLMVVGFVGCGFNAVMFFRVGPFERPVNKAIHMFLHTVAVTLATVGLWAIIHFHKVNKISDVYNAHAYVGCFAYAFFLLQWLLGVGTYAFPCAAQSFRAALMPYHRWLGTVSFVMVTGAVALGCFDRQRISWEVGNASVGYFATTERVGNGLAMCVVLAAVFVSLVLSPASGDGPKPHGAHASHGEKRAHTGEPLLHPATGASA